MFAFEDFHHVLKLPLTEWCGASQLLLASVNRKECILVVMVVVGLHSTKGLPIHALSPVLVTNALQEHSFINC